MPQIVIADYSGSYSGRFKTLIIPMYNNNVKFCGEILKKLGMRYFHGTSADFKVAFFTEYWF